MRKSNWQRYITFSEVFNPDILYDIHFEITTEEESERFDKLNNQFQDIIDELLSMTVEYK